MPFLVIYWAFLGVKNDPKNGPKSSIKNNPKNGLLLVSQILASVFPIPVGLRTTSAQIRSTRAEVVRIPTEKVHIRPKFEVALLRRFSTKTACRRNWFGCGRSTRPTS